MLDFTDLPALTNGTLVQNSTGPMPVHRLLLDSRRAKRVSYLEAACPADRLLADKMVGAILAASSRSWVLYAMQQ